MSLFIYFGALLRIPLVLQNYFFTYVGALRRIPLVFQNSFFTYVGALRRIPLFIAANHIFAAMFFINHTVLFCSSTT